MLPCCLVQQGGPAITFTNPHAQPYAFPAGKHPELSDYLNENSEYDPTTGCLLWTGNVGKTGKLLPATAIGTKYKTRQVTRLAWMAGHGKKPESGTQLVRRCNNPRCIHPDHLTEATAADLWTDPDLPHKRTGSIGALQVGKRIVPAKLVYSRQNWPPPRNPAEGLNDQHKFDPLTVEVIRAIRRCPIRASRTVLPCGFIRFDLPPGITEIAFTEPPPPTYEDVFGWVDDDEDPEDAPEADWAPTAKAA